MSEKKVSTRFASYEILHRIQKNKAYSNLEMKNSEEKYGFESQDRRFVKAIVFTVLERQLLLDYILTLFFSKKADNETMLFLRIGLAQQLFMDVPPSAACNETVKAAKKVLGKSRAGFVNAVLRNIGRNKDKIDSAVPKAPAHIRYSVSESIYKLLYSQYGDKTEKILNSFYNKKPLILRVNTLKTTAQELVAKLEKQNVDAEVIAEKSVSVHKGGSVVLKNLDDGNYFIQGLGSQNAVSLLKTEKGQTVIDVCACPGGKSFGAVIDMQNTGRVISFDIHENKLSLINRQAEKLGVDIICTRHFDSRKVNEELVGKADRVICDVPCSGLGVISSKPEIRYKTADEFEGLYKTQQRIISSASKYLKDGGIMVYSTCTLNKRENEEIVANFLAENSGYKLEYEKTFLPYEEAGEGFYIAKILKI